MAVVKNPFKINKTISINLIKEEKYMRISYSEYKNYLECPKKYKLSSDWVEPPEPQNKYFALYGITIQKFFENYSNYYLKKASSYTQEQVKELLKGIWATVLNKNYVNWREPFVRQNSEGIFNDIYKDILANIDKFDFFSRATSELKIVINLKNSGDQLVGKLDFVFKDENDKIIILDGKGTNKIGKNIDIDQLYFYALIYLLRNKRLPDKLGFLYYKFQTIDYLDFNRDDVINFKNRLAAVKKTIKDEKEFKANVSLSKSCLYCPYSLTCTPCQTKKAENRAKKAARGGGLVIDSDDIIASFGL